MEWRVTNFFSRHCGWFSVVAFAAAAAAAGGWSLPLQVSRGIVEASVQRCPTRTSKSAVKDVQ